MDYEEVQNESVTDVTENIDTQSIEENEEGIDLTDTSTNNENVEKEEVKTYTQAELDDIVNRRLNRQERKLTRDFEKKFQKYEEAESILKVGLGANSIDEINPKLREFYKEQGYDIPQAKIYEYSDDDAKALGEIDARKIIDLGYEEMEDEANRLAAIGSDNMTAREKAAFSKLASELTKEKERVALAKIGVNEVDNDFNKFREKFNSNTPIEDVYEMYTQLNPKKKNIEKIGSMTNQKEPEKKDFYTMEEISKMSKDEIAKNWDIVRKSMTSQEGE